jgi:hypothetical protein
VAPLFGLVSTGAAGGFGPIVILRLMLKAVGLPKASMA